MTSEKKKSIENELNCIMSFQVISSYDHFVSFGNQSYQTMDIGWIPLETPKIGENHVKTKVV